MSPVDIDPITGSPIVSNPPDKLTVTDALVELTTLPKDDKLEVVMQARDVSLTRNEKLKHILLRGMDTQQADKAFVEILELFDGSL